jgi:uncharacterized repeat protein (TIGR04042 family)
MPEVLFRVRWPDGAAATCYSPSTVVKDYFAVGERYSVAEFVELSRTALTLASERVRAKFGVACSRAQGQLAAIEAAAARHPADAHVVFEGFED